MISVITVNYRTVDYVESMLKSLFRFHPPDTIEVFVVDNASGDDLSALQARFPQVRFIPSPTNLGFAGGCNLAIREAHGDFLALINPDIVFTSDALRQIEEKMARDPDVGIGGVSLKNPDGSLQNCVWHFPRPLDQLLVLLKVPHLFKNLKSVDFWRWADFDYAKTQDVDQVMGAFFVIRRALLDQIGPLDDRFFLWYEEVDYCRRAVRAGWRVRYYSDLAAEHRGASSFDRVLTVKKQAALRRSLRRYMKKHFGLGWWLVFVLLNPLFFVLGWLASLIKTK